MGSEPLDCFDIEAMVPGQVYRFPGGIAAGVLEGEPMPLPIFGGPPAQAVTLEDIAAKLDALLEQERRRELRADHDRLTAAWHRSHR